MRSILLCNELDPAQRVYSQETLEYLEKNAGLEKGVFNKKDVMEAPEKFADVDFIFSTWSMPVFTEEEIKNTFKNLKCVFYGAGTVQAFARPFLKCGVKVFSAWAANAVPVAEYTVAQILLANKGFFPCSYYQSKGEYFDSKKAFENYPGNFGEYVGIIGAGMIGKLVIQLLKAFKLKVLVFDPFLPDEKAVELGVKKCSLEYLFEKCFVVSNHLANNAQTQGMLNYDLFKKMRPYSTFINTGRGAQVAEYSLALSLLLHPSRTFVADVIKNEYFPYINPLFWCPNAILTPHIAGSTGNEPQRMAYYMMEELESFISDGKTKYEVTLESLERMA